MSDVYQSRRRAETVPTTVIGLLAVVLFLGPLAPAFAGAWLYHPSIELEQGYEDNYRLSTDSSDEDQVGTTTLTGELALRGKSERGDIEGLLQLDKVFFSGDDEDLNDRNNQLFDLSSRYRLTDRNRLSLDGSFRRDTLLRNETIDINPADVVIAPGENVTIQPGEDTDVNLVDQSIRRVRVRINPGWDYRLTERLSTGLDYRYGRTFYDGGGEFGLVEFQRHQLQGNLSYEVSPKDRVQFRPSASFFRPDDDRDVDTYEARLRLIHDFTETFEMDFSAGGRYSVFDDAEQSSDTGFVAGVGATKRAGLTTFRLDLDRRVTPSGSGDQVTVNSFSMNVDRALSQTLVFDLQGRVFETDRTGGGASGNSDRRQFRFEPQLRWQFLQSWTLEGSYRYERRKLLNTDQTGSNNGAFISLTWSPPSQF